MMNYQETSLLSLKLRTNKALATVKIHKDAQIEFEKPFRISTRRFKDIAASYCEGLIQNL